MARALAQTYWTDPPELWPRGEACALIVPGELVVSLDVDVPTGLRGQKAERIARNGLADCVADPLDALHIVSGPAQPGRYHALAIRADLLEQAVAPRRSEGVFIDAIVPDYLTVPFEPGAVSIKAEQDRLVVRTGLCSGFAAETDFAILLLEEMCERQPFQSIRIEGHSAALEAFCADRALEVQTGSLETDQTCPMNLATGRFSADAGLGARLRLWRLPLGVIAAALVLVIGTESVRINRATDALAEIDHRIETLMRADLVPAGPLLDVRLQTNRALNDLRANAQGGEGAMTQLLRQADQSLLSGARSIKSLEYKDQSLQAELSVTDFRALEVLTTALGRQGLIVQIDRSEAVSGAGVDAVLILTKGGGS